MASVLSRIQIIMEANTANYNNELRRARDHSRSTFGKISKAAGKMALGVGAALAGMGAASVKTAMSFETAMAEVNKTADFVTDDGLANLRKELEDLSKTMPLAFEELADIAASGGQMGIAGENLAGFTETIAKMGIAFDISAGQAAESMGFIASAYQVPIEKLSEVGDAINEVSNNSGATADKTIDFMLRTGAAANNMNIAAEATAAMGAAIIDAGGSVEKSGTAVSNMLLEMANPEWLKDNAGLFAEMGVSASDFAKLVKNDGLEAFKLFREGIISTDDPMSRLRDAFGASAPHIAKLFDETSKLVPLLDAVGQGAEGAATHIGSLDNEYRVMADTTANASVLIKNSARIGAAALGEAFLPAVRDITDALIPMVQQVADWAKANPELIVTVAKVTAVVLSSIIAISSMATAYSKVKLALIALSGPIGLTVIALGILVATGALVYQNWDSIKRVVSENAPVFVALGVTVAALTVALIAANAPLLLLKVQAAATAVQAGIMAAATAGWSVAAGVAAAATWTFNAALAVLTSPIVLAVAAIATIATMGYLVVKNWGAISAGLNAEFNKIKSYVLNTVATMQAAWDRGVANTRGAIINIKNTVITTLRELPSRMLQVGKDIVNGLINGIKQGASGVATAIGSMASSAVAKAKSILDIRSPSRVMKKVGEQTAEGMANGIKKGKKAVVTEAQKMAAEAVKAVKDGIQSLEKELALFGKNNRLAEFNYDVSVGKYKDAAQSDINKTRELLRALNIRNEEADITKEMVSLQRSIYDASVLYSTELGRMNYELDDIHGKYKNINSEIKDSLRDEAAKLDAVKLQATAAKAMMDLDRQMALLGNDDLYSQLAYEMNEATGSLYALDGAMKEAWLSKVALLEQSKKEAVANESIAKSVGNINKELALMDDKTGIAELMHDLMNTDRYANASAESVSALVNAVTKLDNANRAQALTNVMGEIAQESPIGKIEADYQRRLEVLDDYESQWTALVGVHSAERAAIEQSYMDAKRNLMLTQGESLFSDLSGMAKAFAGEQSGIYRALFAVEKGFAIAQSAIAIQQSVAKAMAVGFPQNIPIIGQAVMQGAEIVSNIKSIAMPVGQAHDGIANVPREGTWILDKNERVVKADDNRKLSDFLDGKSKNVGTGDINVNVTVTMDGNSSVESNSQYGKQFGQVIAAVAANEVRKMMRPNGEIDRRYQKR